MIIHNSFFLAKPTDDDIHHTITLAFKGANTYLDSVWLHYDFSSTTYTVSSAPLLQVTRSVLLQGFSIESENWNSLVSADWIETKHLHIRFCCVGYSFSTSLGKLCAQIKVVEIEDVAFADFIGFTRSFISHQQSSECEMIWFSNESVVQYRKEIQQFCSRLGWRICRHTNDEITMVKFPPIF